METNNNLITTDDGKTTGIVSYLTIIGWAVAYYSLHKDKRTLLGSYQLKQTLLLHLIYIAVWIVATVLLRITLSLTLAYIFNGIYIILFILWLIGFIGALQGQKKPIPLIGEQAQGLFPAI